ncbi:hypothetical protein ACFL49_00390, partial [Candidatus Omnitrophota bacterium]
VRQISEEKKILKEGKKNARKNAERLKKQYQENRKEIVKKIETAQEKYEGLWEKQIGALYKEAVTLYEEKQYKQAKIKFASIRALHPKFGSVERYWSKLKKMESRNELEGAEDEDADEGDSVSVDTGESDESIVHESEEKLSQDQKIADEKQVNDLKKIYDEAVLMLHDKKLDLAKEKFDEFEEKLANSGVDEKFEKKMTKKLKGKRKALDKEFKKRDSVIKKREEEMSRRAALSQEKKKKEVKDAEADDVGDSIPVDKAESDGSVVHESEEKLSQDQKIADEKQVNDLKKIYDEAVLMLHNKKFDLAKKKFDEFEEKLANSGVDEKFEKKMIKKLTRKRKTLDKEFLKRDRAIKKREEEMSRNAALSQEKKKKELEALEAKIKEKEAMLKKKSEDLVKKEMEISKASVAPKVVEIKKMDKAQEREVLDVSVGKADQESARREKLKAMIIERKSELELERIEVVKEFNKNLDLIYKKAVKTYGRGRFVDAKKLFLEIDMLNPGYKKTVYYLNKINKKLEKIEASQSMKKPLFRESKNSSSETDSLPLMPMQSRQSVISDALDSLEY